MGFVFFDTETTGLRRGFDQIVHFAAIRTDADLNELERFEARSRLLPQILPHPEAMLTNGLSIGALTDPALASHYEMVSEIRRKLLAWSPAIFVGYNSIKFDEEMLRHALFQCLYPAYLTSQHKNCRADAMALMMSAAGSPLASIVPGEADGAPSFRLQAVAIANGVPVGRGHDAIDDVGATLGLCRLVREGDAELWSRFVRFSNKKAVSDFVEAEDGFVLTEFFKGQAYHSPVTCIGHDPDLATARLCLVAPLDPDDLDAMDDQALAACLAQRPSPIRRVKINAAPALTAIDDATAEQLDGFSPDALGAWARRIRDRQPLRERLIGAYVAAREPFPQSAHHEARLYDAFPSREDEMLAEAFHQAPWPERCAIVDRLADERMRWFGYRLIYCSARRHIPQELRLHVEDRLRRQLNADDDEPLTYCAAIAETRRLMASGLDAAGLLADYLAYLEMRLARSTSATSARDVVVVS